MRIKESSSYRPLMLSDLAKDTSDLPKLTSDQILAMQPESTRRLLKMSDEEHAEFHASEIKYVKMEVDAHKLRPDMVDEDGEYTEKAKEFLKERRKKTDKGHYKAYYRADKSSLIREDNFNGDLQDETPELKKKIARDSMEYHRPQIDPLNNKPIPPPEQPSPKKSIFGTLGDLFKERIPDIYYPNDMFKDKK